MIVHRIHQNSEKWCLLLRESDFKTGLANFSYDYGANVSEAVEKIAKDQKDYHKCSSCTRVC